MQVATRFKTKNGEVIIEYDISSLTYKVWIAEKKGDNVCIIHGSKDGYIEETVLEPGDIPKPTLIIQNSEVLRNIGKCLKEMGLIDPEPQSDFTGEIKRLNDHLKDMRKIVGNELKVDLDK